MRRPMQGALLATAAAVLLPVPALAQDTGETGRLAEELNDPVRQQQMAAVAEAMANVMLEVPVGPLMRAAATMAGEDPEAVDPDLRVADVVGPEAVEAPREIAQRLPQMMGAMAAMSVALEDMLPRLAEIAERVGREARENR